MTNKFQSVELKVSVGIIIATFVVFEDHYKHGNIE